MKKAYIIIYTAILTVAFLFCTVSCSKQTLPKDLWANALYAEDTSFGTGSKTVTLKVEAGEKSVTFTVNTDEKILGDALMEHKLISGEEGAYGLYVKKVNGIVADYDADKSFWSLCSDGEPLVTGVDGVEIADGDCYEFVYTK